MASEQSSSPQIRALHQCSAELVVALSAADPLILWQLLAKDLIGPDTVDYCQLEVTQTKKSSNTVSAVIKTVSASPHLFESLVSVLSESGNTALMSVGEKLKQTYKTLKEQLIETNCHSHSHPHHPPSTPPQLQSPVCRYANYLKAIYSRSELPEYSNPACYKWIPSPGEKFKFINLAVINKKKTNKKEAHKMKREITHGQVDVILKKKTPIALENILQVEQGQSLPCVLIEGAPGIGKSMLAWEICHRWGRGELFQEYSIVLLVTLRDERVQRATCVKDLFYHRDKKLQEEVVQDIDRTNGKGVLILLEGLDELPENFLCKCSLFTELLSGKVFSKATVLVTSRPSAIDKHWQKWWQQKSRHIEILGFSEDNINEYSKSVLPDHQLLGFNNYLSIHPHIKSMMYVPLHCAITTAVYLQCQQSDRAPPKTLTGLYTCLAQTILMQYLQDHPDYKGKIHQSDSFSELPSPIYAQFKSLCSLAFDGVDKQQLIFHNLPQSPDAPKQFEHFGFMNVTTDLFLLSQQSANIAYNFLHLSIQEYLAAYHVSLMSHDQQEQLLCKVRYGDHHFNMVLFLAGMTQVKHLNKELVKKVIGIEYQFDGYTMQSYSGEIDISEYALEFLYECQDVSILDTSYYFYHTNIQSNDSVHRLVALGYCIAKSTSKWHVTFSDRGNYSGTEVFCHSLKENPHPTYIIESIEYSNCTPDFTQQVLQHLPEYALKRIKEISIQHDDTQPLPPYWHQLEREETVELTLENVTATSHYWHKYKNEDYCQPLPPYLPELLLKMENLKTLTLLNILDTSLRELIPVLSKIPTLKNLKVSDVNNYFNMQFSKYRSTGTIESASCTPEFLDQLLPALPQQSIAGIDSLIINYKIGFYMFRSKDKNELDYCQPLPQCLPELILKMEKLTLENVLDTSLKDLIPVLSRVPTLRNLTLHKLNSEGIALLFQWLPTCQLETLALLEEVNKVTLETHANKVVRKITAAFRNNSIEAIKCQYCTPEFMDQVLSQIPQQLLEHIITFTICNGNECKYKYREEEVGLLRRCSDFFQRHYPLRLPEIEVISRMTTLPTPPCLPEVISRMERLKTLKLEKVRDTSLTKLIPALSRVSTLKKLTLHELNSEGIALLCQWLPTCQLKELVIYKEHLNTSHMNPSVEVMTVIFSRSLIECLNSTTEFIDQILQKLPQQIIACVKTLVIHNEKVEDKDSCCTPPPLPPCLPELLPRMKRLNSLTLKNVLDTSLTELIPVLSRVPTLRNLTLHELTNSKNIALLCQWLPTSQLEKLRLHEKMGDKLTHKIKITFCDNLIKVTNCTKEFFDHILLIVSKQFLPCIESLTIATRFIFSQRVEIPPSLSELIPRMERLSTLILESVPDTSLMELIPVLSRVPTLRNLTLHKLNSEGIALLCQWLPTCQLETLKLPYLSSEQIEIVFKAITTVSSPITLNIERSNFTFQALQAFVSMLQQNSSLTDVNITSCSIDSESACCLAKALHHNTTLRKLDLSRNSVGEKGILAMAEMLKCNTTLEEMCLNFAEGCGAVAIAKALHHNTTLRKLYTNWIPVGEKGILAMAEMLKHNTTLEELDLCHTEISIDGTIAMADALHHNTTLRKLDMRGNSVGERGALAMAEMLKHNTTLEELNLNWTKFSSDGAVAMAEALHHNTTLRKLDLALNPVEEQGILAMAEMLKHSTALEELNLSALITKQNPISNSCIKALVESLAVNQHLKKLIILEEYERFVVCSLPLYSALAERVVFRSFNHKF